MAIRESAALVALLALLLAPPALGQALDQAVKATFIYKFAAFVEWPPDGFESAEAPLVICVAGSDSVAGLIDEATRGQALATRPFAVRRLSQPAQAAACHVLFVDGTRNDAIAGYLQAARGRPVLTVTDDANESRAKGVMNFVLRDNRVRFEIDLDKAVQQRLVLSSKLASLAVNAASPR